MACSLGNPIMGNKKNNNINVYYKYSIDGYNKIIINAMVHSSGNPIIGN